MTFIMRELNLYNKLFNIIIIEKNKKIACKNQIINHLRVKKHISLKIKTKRSLKKKYLILLLT